MTAFISVISPLYVEVITRVCCFCQSRVHILLFQYKGRDRTRDCCFSLSSVSTVCHFIKEDEVVRVCCVCQCCVHPHFINPLPAPARKVSGLKREHRHTCKQHIWWAYNNSTFNTVHFGRSPFTCSCEKGEWGDLKVKVQGF